MSARSSKGLSAVQRRRQSSPGWDATPGETGLGEVVAELRARKIVKGVHQQVPCTLPWLHAVRMVCCTAAMGCNLLGNCSGEGTGAVVGKVARDGEARYLRLHS